MIKKKRTRLYKTITVAPHGKDCQTVTEAIRIALSRGSTTVNPWTIIVYPGVYSEDVVCDSSVKIYTMPEVSIRSIAYKQAISISGNGSSDITEAVIPFNIHRNTKKYNTSSERDIFLDNLCKTDFSDLYFTDSNGNVLDHYLGNNGNYEVCEDTSLGEVQYVVPSNLGTGLREGDIIASNIASDSFGSISLSHDNGDNWELIGPETFSWILLYVNDAGDIFANRSSNDGVYKGVHDGTNWNWTKVLDLSGGGTVGDASGWIVMPFAFDRSPINDYYIAGRYQAANDPVIYTSNDGISWSILYSQDPITNQHCHLAKFDPYTGYLYVGLDGGTHKIIRCKDIENPVWEDLLTGVGGDVIAAVFTKDYIYFAAGATGASGGKTVMRMDKSDDSFEVVLPNSTCPQSITIVNNILYAGLCLYHVNKTPSIVRSADNGETWQTIWEGDYTDSPSSFGGPRMQLNTNNPSGDDIQTIFSSFQATTIASPLRLYDGGNHYQAEAYVKIPTLSKNGTTIYAYYGTKRALSLSKKTAATKVNLGQVGDILHFKLDGNGNDSSGNGYNLNAANNNGGVTFPSGSLRGVGYRQPELCVIDNGNYYQSDGTDFLRYYNASASPAPGNVTNNFTLSAWIRCTQDTPGVPQIICMRGAYGGQNTQYQLNLSSGQKILQFVNGNGIDSWPAKNCDITLFFADNVRHRVGVIVNDTGTAIKFIVDSRQSPDWLELTYPIIEITTRNAWGIGANPWSVSPTAPFYGQIDEVVLRTGQETEQETLEQWFSKPMINELN